MKTCLVFGAVMISLILLAFISQNTNSFPGAAMEEIGAEEAGKAYVVQEGDTLWELAGEKLGDPKVWKKIFENNPFLRQDGRLFKKGEKIVVLLFPGERLQGLEEIGIMPKFLPLPESELEITPKKVSNVPLAPADTENGSAWWKWPIIILLMIGLIIAGCMWVRSMFREATANPATSGPPAVEGGILPNDTQAVRERLLEIGRDNFQRQNPGISTPGFSYFEIQGEPEVGRVYGLASIRYGDGNERVKRFEGETAYRANIRYPDGRIEEHIFLAACANDLRRGVRYVPGADFRFEPTGIVTENGVAPLPQPEMAEEPEEEEEVVDEVQLPLTPEPAVQIALPAPAPVADVRSVQPESSITIVMDNDRVELEIDNHRVVIIKKE